MKALSRFAAFAPLALAAVCLLQGCGGGGGGTTTPGPSPAPPTPGPPTPAPPSPWPPIPGKIPLRGIAYGALPCSAEDCAGKGQFSQDMVQAGYSAQWGPDGRDDLGSMKTLGANAVRLYHSFGLDTKHDHGAFLDRAAALGLNVLPGVHTDLACPENDCYESWKKAIKAGFHTGFQRDGAWHPAVSIVILSNEPDFTPCDGGAGWCRVKRALSAMEGLLDAEKEMKVKPGKVKLTITWSFAMKTSVDGKVTGPGYYGFQDMVAGTADPSIANYKPRSSQAELLAAFDDRWIHSVNTQAPWSFVRKMVGENYKPFLPKQWFIGEYGANEQKQTAIANDLQTMDSFARTDRGFFGVCFFQFQAAYVKSGTELHFGLFSLGTNKIGDTGEVCNDNEPDQCGTYPVYCLNTQLPWFSKTPDLDHRAEAAAKGWGGSAENKGRCAQAAITV